MDPRRTGACLVGMPVLVLALAGCFRSVYVDDPAPRNPAKLVASTTTSPHCPRDTVLLGDDEPGSGAGAIPTDFEARTVVWCFVDYGSVRTLAEVDRFTMTEVRTEPTRALLQALSSPDRTGPAGCSTAAGNIAVHLANADRELVRVDVPQDPCGIHAEVQRLLPDQSTPPTRTFTVDRPR